MHGGSGSSAAEIGEAVGNGVIKMNIDTDTQWAYWDGLKNFYKKNEGFLQGQVRPNRVSQLVFLIQRFHSRKYFSYDCLLLHCARERPRI